MPFSMMKERSMLSPIGHRQAFWMVATRDIFTQDELERCLEINFEVRWSILFRSRLEAKGTRRAPSGR